MLHDDYCHARIAACPAMMVPWWIMAAWAYEKGEPILTDATFDAIAARLGREWDEIEHRHKPLLDRDSLKSSLAIGDRWPVIAVHAARSLMAATVSPPPQMPEPTGFTAFVAACKEIAARAA